MQMFTISLSILQFIVYIYIIIINRYIQNEIWYLSVTGLINNFLIFINFMIRKINERSNENINLIKINEEDTDLIDNKKKIKYVDNDPESDEGDVSGF